MPDLELKKKCGIRTHVGTQRTAMVCRSPGGMATAMTLFVAAQQHMQTRTPMKSATRPGQHRSKDNLIAFDDSELSDWVITLGEERSARFLCALAEAVMKADPEEYSVIRPALVNLKRKYAEAGPGPEGFADAITSRKGPPRNNRVELIDSKTGEPIKIHDSTGKLVTAKVYGKANYIPKSARGD